MLLIDFLYIVFAFLYTAWMVWQAKNKLITGLFMFWFFGYPILANPKYEIVIGGIDFVLLPNRILLVPLFLIVLVGLLQYLKLRSRLPSGIVLSSHTLYYEKWILVYVLAILVSEITNYDRIGLRTVIQTVTDSLCFVLFYFSIRWLMGQKDFHLLLRTFLVFAIISAAAALVQFLIDPDFLRRGAYRWAFDRYIRANGLFSSEYDQGLFQVSGLLICFFLYRNRLLHFLVILLTGAAVLVTMHRLSWGVWCVGLMLICYNEITTRRYSFAGLYIGSLVLVIIISIGTARVLETTFFRALRERIYANTLTIRTDYYSFGIDVIRSHPLGIGFYWTTYYSQLAYNKGMPFNFEDYEHPVAYVIHNGFLSAGVLHGITGFIAFLLFNLGNLLFYLGKFREDSQKFLLPFGMSAIFIMYNLTQDFSNIGSQILILYGVLLAGFASYSLRYLKNRNDPHGYRLS
jgi:hypothetical protein